MNNPITTQALRAQLDSLREFAEAEFAAQRSEFARLWSMPLEARLAEGRCVHGLRFERKTMEGQYLFSYEENDTDFREGDYLRLSEGDPLSPLTDCILVAEDPPYLTLDFSGKGKDFLRYRDLCLDASYFDLEQIVLQGIDQLGATLRGRERILPLLLGDAVVDEVDQTSFDEAWLASDAADYNNSQSDAIAAGAASQWCSLIQGPPGTGKTRVLAEIVAQRLARGEKIFVTAFTHRAIHQALKTIKQALPDEDRIVKIGTYIPDAELPVSQYESFAESPLTEMTGGYVIGATVFATRSRRLKGIDFDVLIIDEASQMTLPYAVLGMLTSDSYVIIGDPQQLPPVVQSRKASESHELSIFNALNRRNDLSLLDTTYRMNAAIAEWSSGQFYRGELSSSPLAAARKLELPCGREPAWLKNAFDPEHSLVWLEHDEAGCRKLCLEEVDVVNQLVTCAVKHGLSPSDLAVVTPFRKQARAMRQRVRQTFPTDTAAGNQIVIDTVERMQGQERAVIIISCAASDHDFIRYIADFLFLPARLNVSVTRARCKVILICSSHLLQVDCMHTDDQEARMVWHNLRAASEVIKI
ncbi:MAG: DNA2/NAM7 family helicase [Opitutales bacterium]|nr:DNA2/NAM7 family helicase [Opitutales bacterium]NRA27778.1 AAA family ATPase [Opitutales bacterium]